MSALPGAPGPVYAGDEQKQRLEIERRRRMAQVLGGMQPQQAQMVGGQYIAPSPLSHLVSALGKVGGAHLERRADQQQGELDARERQRLIEAMGKVGGQQAPEGALDALGNEQLKQLYGQQVAGAMTPQQPKGTPSITEYEYAKQNGFRGSFQDWVSTGGGAQRDTADIQNWKFVQNLPEDQRAQFQSLMRQPTAPQVVDIGGVPHLVDRLKGSVTPLTSLQDVAEAKRVTSRAGAVGAAEGAAAGDVQAKGIQAMSTLDALDLAEPLIDAATGSLAGAARDKLASVFGVAPEGAQATAQLRVLQANLMTNMPRMEGPQSDRDVELYKQAAAQLGDPTIPRETKRAAIQMIRQISQKYVQRAGMAADQGAATAPGGWSIEPVQ